MQSFTQLVAYCQTLNGQRLPTAGGRTTFTVHADDKEVRFTPHGRATLRPMRRDNVEAVLARLAEIGDYSPGRYSDLTRQSSYILAVLARLREEGGHRRRPEEQVSAGPGTVAMFTKNQQYTRASIRQLLGLPEARGGAWATGHVRHAGEHFLFCGIDTPGRTGQNYNNHFDIDELVWHPRDDANPRAPVFSELISGIPVVHVFYRSDDRDPFTYAGIGRPASIRKEPSIEVRWAFDEDAQLPEEIDDREGVLEGAKKRIVVNAYERDPNAKPRCLKRWGTSCHVCGFDFSAVYGELGKGFIHVHHLKPIHTIGAEYVLDPENDLRPVCPNCHSMLHRRKQTLSIDELVKLLRRRFD